MGERVDRVELPDLITSRRAFDAPTFSLANRIRRMGWKLCHVLFFRFSPIPCHRFRVLLLRLWGARVSARAHVYPSVTIWAPWNLEMDEFATLAPRVNCYNVAPVVLGKRAIVSQGAYLCTPTHDYDDPAFTLYARAITLEADAWVCADAFVAPGVTLHEGSILGARGVATKDLPAWEIHAGNPAIFRKVRQQSRGR